MKIIAISDTHIKFGSIRDHLPEDLVDRLEKADLILHAGDFVRKKAYDEFCALNRIEAVHGNMDEPELKNMLPERKVIKIEGMKPGSFTRQPFQSRILSGRGTWQKRWGQMSLFSGISTDP